MLSTNPEQSRPLSFHQANYNNKNTICSEQNPNQDISKISKIEIKDNKSNDRTNQNQNQNEILDSKQFWDINFEDKENKQQRTVWFNDQLTSVRIIFE